MARRKRHNPERRLWRGRSYKKGGRRIRTLILPRRCAEKQEDETSPYCWFQNGICIHCGFNALRP